MNPASWEQAKDVITEALRHAPAEREQFVRQRNDLFAPESKRAVLDQFDKTVKGGAAALMNQGLEVVGRVVGLAGAAALLAADDQPVNRRRRRPGLAHAAPRARASSAATASAIFVASGLVSATPANP